MSYEPSTTEIRLTLGAGVIIAPLYHRYVLSLPLQGSETVLDFGSGSGILSRHLADRLAKGGGHLTCVDISSRWMAVIRKTLRRFTNVSYRLGHISQVDLPDASFDAVLIHYVLHDIPAGERALVLHTLARKLKPGGRLLLREPQDHGLAARELHNLTAAAGLKTDRLEARNVWLGPVFDACFTRKAFTQMGDVEIRHASDAAANKAVYTSNCK